MMNLNEFMNTYAENYEKDKMISKIIKKYKFSSEETEKYYNNWRKEYLSKRVVIAEEKPVIKKTKSLEEVISGYSKRNRKGITLEQLKWLAYFKKQGITDIDMISRETRMARNDIWTVYTVMNQHGYKVHDFKNIDFNKLSV